MLGRQARDAYATGQEVVQRLERLAGRPVREGVGSPGWPEARRLGPGHRRRRAPGQDGGRRHRRPEPGPGPDPGPPPPGRVAQLHAADYRGPGQLPGGAVLVVGSAQSGCQIAEDLLAGGRRVILATSPVGRVPFRHRGRETVEWLAEAGFMDQRPRDLPDPSVMRAAMPIIAPGRGLSLPALAQAGATLAGRPVAVVGAGRLRRQPGRQRGRRGRLRRPGQGDGGRPHPPRRPGRAARRARRARRPRRPGPAGLARPARRGGRRRGLVHGLRRRRLLARPFLAGADGQPRHADGARPPPACGTWGCAGCAAAAPASCSASRATPPGWPARSRRTWAAEPAYRNPSSPAAW